MWQKWFPRTLAKLHSWNFNIQSSWF
jgi:hypothetical protein